MLLTRKFRRLRLHVRVFFELLLPAVTINTGLLSLHSFEDLQSHIDTRPRKVLSTVDKPLDSADHNNNRKCHNAVI